MGGEYFLAVLVALILWGFIGLMVASVALTVWKLERIPWPLIGWVTVIGAFLTVVLFPVTAVPV